PIKVTGTEIIAVTGAVSVSGCADVTGPSGVVNIGSGDSAVGLSFTFKVPKAVIVNVTPTTVTAGSPITIEVANASAGIVKFKIGTQTVFATAPLILPNGNSQFTITVPTNLVFPSVPCTVGGVTGTTAGPLNLDVTFTN